MRKLIIGWLLVIGIVSVGRACEHCAALAVGNVVPAKVKYFGLKEVRLLDSPFKNAMDRNAAWMLEMDMDRLLSNFLKNAGLEPKGESVSLRNSRELHISYGCSIRSVRIRLQQRSCFKAQTLES